MFISFETGKILKSQKFQIDEKKSAYNFLCSSKAMDAHFWKKYLKKSHCGLLGPDRSRFGIRK